MNPEKTKQIPNTNDDDILLHDAQEEVRLMGNNRTEDYKLEGTTDRYCNKKLVNQIFQEMYQKKKTCIKRVYVTELEISDETVNVICNLKWLRGLYLPFNNLTNASVQKIAKELQNLEELCLAGNMMIDDISPLKEMKNLKLLWMDETQVRLTLNDIDNWIVGSQLEDVCFQNTLTGVEEIDYLRQLWNTEKNSPQESTRRTQKDNQDNLTKNMTQDVVETQTKANDQEGQDSQHKNQKSEPSFDKSFPTQTSNTSGNNYSRRFSRTLNDEMPQIKTATCSETPSKCLNLCNLI